MLCLRVVLVAIALLFGVSVAEDQEAILAADQGGTSEVTSDTSDKDASIDQAGVISDDSSDGSEAEDKKQAGDTKEDVQDSQDNKKVMSDPVKEVIRVLKALAKRVSSRDNKETKLYQEFGDFCYHGVSSLEKSFKESQAELPTLSLSLAEATRRREGLQTELHAVEDDEASVRSALLSADDLRQKEVNAHQTELERLRDNLRQLANLETESSDNDTASGSLLQFSGMAASSNAEAALDQSFSSASASELLELLKAPAATEAEKIQVVKMLRRMKQKMEAEVRQLLNQEAHHEAVFNGMTKAKRSELVSVQKSLQDKKERDATYQQTMVSLQKQLTETQAVVDDADSLIKELRAMCGLRRTQHSNMHDKIQREVEALHSAARFMLAGDQLAMFKPASLGISTQNTLVTLLQVVREHRSEGAAMQAANLRGSSKAGKDVDKITKLVDAMVSVLEQEQIDDDKKIENCKTEEGETAEEEGALGEENKGKKADVASMASQIEKLEADVAEEQRTILRVDWVVKKGTELREKEHKHLAGVIAQGAAAVDVLNRARMGLMNFLREGGTLSPPQPQLASDSDDLSFLNEAAGPVGPDPKQVQAALSDVILAIKHEIDIVRNREVVMQAAYEKLIKIAQASRSEDTKALTAFVGGADALAVAAQTIQDEQAAVAKQLGLADSLAATLKAQCDKLLAEHSQKKEFRTNEIESLKMKKQALIDSLR